MSQPPTKSEESIQDPTACLDLLPAPGVTIPLEVSRCLAFSTPNERDEREPTRIVNLRRRLQRMVQTRDQLAGVEHTLGAKPPDNRQLQALSFESMVVWEILQWEKHRVLYAGRPEQRWIPPELPSTGDGQQQAIDTTGTQDSGPKRRTAITSSLTLAQQQQVIAPTQPIPSNPTVVNTHPPTLLMSDAQQVLQQGVPNANVTFASTLPHPSGMQHTHTATTNRQPHVTAPTNTTTTTSKVVSPTTHSTPPAHPSSFANPHSQLVHPRSSTAEAAEQLSKKTNRHRGYPTPPTHVSSYLQGQQGWAVGVPSPSTIPTQPQQQYAPVANPSYMANTSPVASNRSSRRSKEQVSWVVWVLSSPPDNSKDIFSHFGCFTTPLELYTKCSEILANTTRRQQEIRIIRTGIAPSNHAGGRWMSTVADKVAGLARETIIGSMCSALLDTLTPACGLVLHSDNSIELWTDDTAFNVGVSISSETQQHLLSTSDVLTSAFRFLPEVQFRFVPHALAEGAPESDGIGRTSNPQPYDEYSTSHTATIAPNTNTSTVSVPQAPETTFNSQGLSHLDLDSTQQWLFAQLQPQAASSYSNTSSSVSHTTTTQPTITTSHDRPHAQDQVSIAEYSNPSSPPPPPCPPTLTTPPNTDAEEEFSFALNPTL